MVVVYVMSGSSSWHVSDTERWWPFGHNFRLLLHESDLSVNVEVILMGRTGGNVSTGIPYSLRLCPHVDTTSNLRCWEVQIPFEDNFGEAERRSAKEWRYRFRVSKANMLQKVMSRKHVSESGWRPIQAKNPENFCLLDHGTKEAVLDSFVVLARWVDLLLLQQSDPADAADLLKNCFEAFRLHLDRYGYVLRQIGIPDLLGRLVDFALASDEMQGEGAADVHTLHLTFRSLVVLILLTFGVKDFHWYRRKHENNTVLNETCKVLLPLFAASSQGVPDSLRKQWTTQLGDVVERWSSISPEWLLHLLAMYNADPSGAAIMRWYRYNNGTSGYLEVPRFSEAVQDACQVLQRDLSPELRESVLEAVLMAAPSVASFFEAATSVESFLPASKQSRVTTRRLLPRQGTERYSPDEAANSLRACLWHKLSDMPLLDRMTTVTSSLEQVKRVADTFEPTLADSLLEGLSELAALPSFSPPLPPLPSIVQSAMGPDKLVYTKSRDLSKVEAKCLMDMASSGVPEVREVCLYVFKLLFCTPSVEGSDLQCLAEACCCFVRQGSPQQDSEQTSLPHFFALWELLAAGMPAESAEREGESEGESDSVFGQVAGATREAGIQSAAPALQGLVNCCGGVEVLCSKVVESVLLKSLEEAMQQMRDGNVLSSANLQSIFGVARHGQQIQVFRG